MPRRVASGVSLSIVYIGSGKQLFPGVTATGINSGRGALPVEIKVAYTLNVRSSRAPDAFRAPEDMISQDSARAPLSPASVTGARELCQQRQGKG